jgi:hypothetical protein
MHSTLLSDLKAGTRLSSSFGPTLMCVIPLNHACFSINRALDQHPNLEELQVSVIPRMQRLNHASCRVDSVEACLPAFRQL